MVNSERLYKFHVENLRSLEIALNDSARACRREIASENDAGSKSHLSLYAFLVGAWAECRLSKCLFEQDGFSAEVRDDLYKIPSQLDRWKGTVARAFRLHFDIPTRPLSEQNIPFSDYSRFVRINEILENELRSVIEIRNKLAHGQWIYPLNSDGTDVENQKYKELKEENIQSLQFKHSMISSLADILHDLVVSKPTFDRDFDRHFARFSGASINRRTRSYEAYRNQLIVKKQRGRIRRREATNTSGNSESCETSI